MTDREIMREFKQIRDAIFNTNCDSSKYNDLQHEHDNQLIRDNEDALIETDAATNDRITEIEDALIELDNAINGGTDNG